MRTLHGSGLIVALAIGALAPSAVARDQVENFTGSLICTPEFSGSTSPFGGGKDEGNAPITIDIAAAHEAGGGSAHATYVSKDKKHRVSISLKLVMAEPPARTPSIQVVAYYDTGARKGGTWAYQTEFFSGKASADLSVSPADTMVFQLKNSGKTTYPFVNLSCYRTRSKKPSGDVTGDAPSVESNHGVVAHKPTFTGPAPVHHSSGSSTKAR